MLLKMSADIPPPFTSLSPSPYPTMLVRLKLGRRLLATCVIHIVGGYVDDAADGAVVNVAAAAAVSFTVAVNTIPDLAQIMLSFYYRRRGGICKRGWRYSTHKL